MDNLFKIEVDVWNMREGEITELKHNDTIFTIKQPKTTRIEIPMEITAISSSPAKKKYPHGVKISYLEKWIQSNTFDGFTLDMFFKAFPKQKENKNLNSNISKLIADGMLVQMGKDRFKVKRGEKKKC